MTVAARIMLLVLVGTVTALGAPLPPLAAATSRVSAMLYVWTQHYSADGGRKLEDNLDEALAATARAGFTVVEGWLEYFATPERAAASKAALDRHGLAMRAVYTGGRMHEADPATAAIDLILARATIARAHGVDTIVMNPDQMAAEKTDAELAVQSQNLDRLGAALRAMGLRFAIHQHDREMRSGAREWYHILRNTKPENVAFCLDLHWVYRGGQDPLTLLKAAGTRVADLHLRNSVNTIWSEDFGPGDVDYGPIAAQLKAVRYTGLLTVELAYEAKTEKTRSLELDLARSRAYMKTVFGE